MTQGSHPALTSGAYLPSGSAHPHVLDDPAQWILIERGYLDVFAVFGAPLEGRRLFLFRLEEGALARGIAAAALSDGRSLALVGVGGADSALRRCAPGEPVAAEAVQRWQEVLAQAADLPPVPDDAAEGGERSDAVLLLALANSLCEREALRSQHDWRSERRKLGEARKTQALSELASAAAGHAIEAAVTPAAAEDPDPLRSSLLRIFGALKVAPKLEAFDTPGGLEEGRSRLDIIVSRHQMTRRTVLLRPGWTLLPGLPLIGFMGEERRPVALLFRKGRWHVHDGPRVTPIASDGTEGSGTTGLAADAVQIYPALPASSLCFRDLFAFGFASLAADRVRLVLLMLAAAILATLVPYGSRFLVSDAIPYANLNLTWVIIGGLLAAALARAVFDAGKGLTMLRSELGFESRLQPAMLLRLLRLPPAFFRRYAVGDISDRVLGIQAAREVITSSFTSAAASSVFSIISLVPILTVDKRLALIVLLLAVFIGLINVAISYRALIHERQRMALKGRIESFVVQMLMGVTKLKASASEAMGFGRWSGLFAQNMRHAVKAGRWTNLQGAADALLPQLATIVLYAMILYFLKADMEKAASGGDAGKGFSLADFITVSTAFAQVLGGISALAGALIQSLSAVPLIERAGPIIEVVPDAPPPESRPVKLSGAIDIRNVSFRYSEKAPLALNELSVRIGKGEFVAIVGASGSGKSTLLRLLLGFDRPELGDIFFDGHSLSRLDLAQVRRQIGVVLQHGRIMAGSIHDNIAGESGLGMDASLEAAKMVGLDKDIEQMPMGLHTVMLDGGGTLSGGQRQRILLARALISKPAVLFLDEATSALDNRTQAIVTETLQRLPVTRLVIAHRLSTIESVDRIIMLDKGRVVEAGSYAELMALNGHFAAHARRQLV